MMKKFVGLLLLLISPLLFAETTAFDMTLDKTTVADLKRTYPKSHTFYKKVNQYSAYTISSQAVDFDGLKLLRAIFDEKGKLAIIYTEFPKDKTNYLQTLLSEKYQLVQKSKNAIGDKIIAFETPDAKIILDSRHFTDIITLTYLRNSDADSILQNSKQHLENKQKQKEKSKL